MTIRYGETLRKIRTDFAMPQEKLAQGIINRSSLAKFENEQMSIPIEQFHQLLERLDISFPEFLYLSQNYRLTAKEKMFREFLNLPKRPSKVELINLETRCEKVNQNLKNTTLKQIQRLCQTALYYMEHQEFDDYFEEFWAQLNKKNRWHYLDICLLQRFLAIFPTGISSKTYKEILKYLTKYQHFGDSELLLTTVHLNFSELLIKENNIQFAINSLSIAQRYALKIHRYDILATCYVRLGMIKNNPTMCKKGFDLLELTQEFGLTKVLHKEMENYQKNLASESL